MGSLLSLTGADQPSMENPSLELMMRQAFPGLASAVRGRSPRILDRFITMVKEVLPSADEVTLNELLDHLPQALEDLAVAIAATGGEVQRDFLAESRQHGVCRYHQSFNLSELLVEYSILRSIVIEEVTISVERPLKLDEVSCLNVGLDAAARRAVESFVSYQQREIQSSAEAQTKYLAFLSHDLRGSLNAVLLTMEVLRRDLSGVEKRRGMIKDLESMRRSILDTVGRMDLFVFADRLRQGKLQPKPGNINLAIIIPEIAAQFSEAAGEKGLEILVDTSAQPTAVSDRALLGVILQSLLGNAVKFSGKGKIHVKTQPASGGGCRISVADEGLGIAAARLKQIFQPAPAAETPGKQMGLGLVIAHQSAALLNATLEVESEMGKGTTFRLDLPGPTGGQQG
ncbi:MAG TPA: HAMP domain-containing sensor histidine kinase [Tepidisphaeraceae bacterium]|jgi:signal transduction histidine kinase|nr:HAMP domain-containing sensor histidine kinase [Tepidisphaeraceae bacterium]